MLLNFPLSYPLHFLWGQWYRIPLPPPDRFAGQTILVTGANVGLGLEAARHFARLGAARVILACRSVEKAEQAVADVRAALPTDAPLSCQIEGWDVDLTSFASVVAFAERAVAQLDRLDAVVENAGLARSDFAEAEGFESTITVNVLSPTLLALLLLPLLRRTAVQHNVQPRLTLVASDAHYFARFAEAQDVDIFDAYKDPARMSHDRYNTSKLLDILLARQLGAVFAERRIPVVANSLNPGFCRTELFRALPTPARQVVHALLLLIGRAPAMGARTLVAAAAAGPESQGQFMDSGLVWPPSRFVTSDAGALAQKRVFSEVLAILEEVKPGVSKNLE